MRVCARVWGIHWIVRSPVFGSVEHAAYILDVYTYLYVYIKTHIPAANIAVCIHNMATCAHTISIVQTVNWLSHTRFGCWPFSNISAEWMSRTERESAIGEQEKAKMRCWMCVSEHLRYDPIECGARCCVCVVRRRMYSKEWEGNESLFSHVVLFFVFVHSFILPATWLYI